eukprot:1923836-Prymnesium_polylepis.2
MASGTASGGERRGRVSFEGPSRAPPCDEPCEWCDRYSQSCRTTRPRVSAPTRRGTAAGRGCQGAGQRGSRGGGGAGPAGAQRLGRPSRVRTADHRLCPRVARLAGAFAPSGADGVGAVGLPAARGLRPAAALREVQDRRPRARVRAPARRRERDAGLAEKRLATAQVHQQ